MASSCVFFFPLQLEKALLQTQKTRIENWNLKAPAFSFGQRAFGCIAEGSLCLTFCNPSFKFSSLIFVQDQDTCPGHPGRHISLTLTAASAASLLSPGMFLPGRCALCVWVCVCVCFCGKCEEMAQTLSLYQCRIPALAFPVLAIFLASCL